MRHASSHLVRHTRRALAVVSAAVLALTAAPNWAWSQNGPPPQVRAAVKSIEDMLTSAGDGPLQAFAAERLTPEFRATFRGDSLLRHLRAIRSAVGDVGGVMLRRDAGDLVMEIEGGHRSALRFALDSAFKITKLQLANDALPAPAVSPWAGVTWENFQAKAGEAAAAGFSGVVLARRNGAELFRGAMGAADPASRRPTALNTVYCIGSQPIDFTITGVMLLGQQGKLKLDDPITRFFPGAPADKRPITIRQLLTGGSGLIDFFGSDSLDWDPDLSWITRDEAVRRIMATKLRFAPGTAKLHAHAAFVLLAAVIERASGQPYREFIRKELLTPLKMNRTGFYGESLGLTVADFAVGSGPSMIGLPNIPPNWGPTSWLVMGSGGMVSTLDDMAAYYEAIDRGTLLTGEWARWQQGARSGSGGSDRGYFIHRVSDGKGNSILFLTNVAKITQNAPPMERAMDQLVLGAARP